MCSRVNLKTLFNLSIFLKFTLCVALIVIGSIFVADPDVSQAYGTVIVSTAVGFSHCVIAPLSQYIGSRGSVQHVGHAFDHIAETTSSSRTPLVISAAPRIPSCSLLRRV